MQEPLTDYHRNEAKKEIFLEKKGPKWPTQKTEFFKINHSQKNFAKISEIGPWIKCPRFLDIKDGTKF